MDWKLRPFLFFPLIIILSVFSSTVPAARLGFGLGGYALDTPAQKNVQGSKESSSLDPGLSISYQMQIQGEHFFLPRLGHIQHSKSKDNYGKQTRTTLFVLWDLGYRAHPQFLFRYGLGTFITKISGDGGEVSVRNGQTGTQTAYKPTQQKNAAYNTTLDLGLAYTFDPHWSLEVDTYIFAWAASHRYLTYSGSLNFYF